MKIGILPLDSRPCNYIFPHSLGVFANVECFTPPRKLMDNFLQSADCEGLAFWLEQITPACDALVVSIDMLAYGGFIAARANNTDIETALKRISVLRQIKKTKPVMPIYASSVVIRPTISIGNKEMLPVYEKLYQYSRAAYLAEEVGTPEYIAEKSRLVSEIPGDVLEKFLTMRKRNAAVNKEAIQLAADGIFEYLLLLQEDSEPYGIQRKEQKELAHAIEQKQLQHKITIQNGADESGCLLAAKALLETGKRQIPVEIKFSNEANKNFIAMYEDRPFIENLKSSLKFLNIQDVTGTKDILYILTPKTTQADAGTAYASGRLLYTKEEIHAFASEILRYIKQGRRVYLLDVLYSNGGGGDILHAIGEKVDLRELWGYSAWNTACNSLGTILAQLVFSYLSGKRNDAFTAERVLDDYFYQTVVRQKISHALREKNQDVWNIENLNAANEKLAELMQDEKHLTKFFRQVPQFHASLPWNRLFEVNITIE